MSLGSKDHQLLGFGLCVPLMAGVLVASIFAERALSVDYSLWFHFPLFFEPPAEEVEDICEDAGEKYRNPDDDCYFTEGGSCAPDEDTTACVWLDVGAANMEAGYAPFGTDVTPGFIDNIGELGHAIDQAESLSNYPYDVWVWEGIYEGYPFWGQALPCGRIDIFVYPYAAGILAHEFGHFVGVEDHEVCVGAVMYEGNETGDGGCLRWDHAAALLDGCD